MSEVWPEIMVVVGIAMLQGARHAHIDAIQKASDELSLTTQVVELRTAEDLQQQDIDALLLPGGESTVMRLRGNDQTSRLLPALFSWMRENDSRPVLATCAGAILMADPQDGGAPLVDAEIDRNAYGGQVDSFESTLDCGFQGFSFVLRALGRYVMMLNAHYLAKSLVFEIGIESPSHFIQN